MASPLDQLVSGRPQALQLLLLQLLILLSGVQCQDTCSANILVAAVLGTFFSTIVAVAIVLLTVYCVQRHNKKKISSTAADSSSVRGGGKRHADIEEKQAIEMRDGGGHGQSRDTVNTVSWAATLTQAECTERGYPGFVMCREYVPTSENEKSGTANQAFQADGAS